MAKPHPATELLNWMTETGHTDTSLANKISELDPTKTVSARQVARWRKGLFIPRAYYMDVLTKLSGGRVDANSFAEARKKELPKDGESG